MKITKYIGALAFVAMLAACSNEEEQGINTLSNVVEVTANVGKNSIFTRSNPVGKTEEALSVFNDGDLIRILTNGKTVNYTKSGDNWIPENGDYLCWTGGVQEFKAIYPYSASENTVNTIYSGYVSADQSTLDKIAKSDYMWTSRIDAKAPQDRMLVLYFQRQTARVVVRVSSFGNEFDGLKPVLTDVKVYSKLHVSAEEQVGENENIEEITAYKDPTPDENGNNVFYALVAPGEKKDGENFLKLTVTYNDEDGNPTLSKDLFVKGIPAHEKSQSYTYNVKIGKDNAAVGNVKVTDWSTGSVIKGGDAVTTTENALLVIEKALAANKKNIEITLDANADKSVFDAIREALKSASEGSINLTVYGVETLPPSAFTDCKPLKSISLPEVKSIDRYAFQECNRLETIYAPIVSSISDCAFLNCPRLISVTLGNISAAGIRIFDFVPTDFVDLTLSKDQKVMTGSDDEGWQSVESKYARSDDHLRVQFLGKEFHSITCGNIKFEKY
ncbi:fimbrillin family protein [Segatella copri]|uniref:fimbrillin family protein n=1 Tax=Segatella copri TaxID=165179 RepID=UPI00222E6CBD|nr:fimbrillin family protein [Segatella copri]MCW4081665.1 fimbrillin family protein [Segatella copri]